MAGMVETLAIPRASAPLAPVAGSFVSDCRAFAAVRFSEFRGFKIEPARSTASLGSASRLGRRGSRIVCEAQNTAVGVSFLQSLGGHGLCPLLAAVTTQRSTRSPPLPLPLVVEAQSATRRENRTARHSRIRKKVEGTPERPRLCVFRSSKHLYVQVIDDTKMHTLASASTMQKPISDEFDYTAGPTIDVARRVGEVIAKSCIEKGITKVAFDRGGYPYHGRIQALADAAREQGLEF